MVIDLKEMVYICLVQVHIQALLIMEHLDHHFFLINQVLDHGEQDLIFQDLILVADQVLDQTQISSETGFQVVLAQEDVIASQVSNGDL